MYDKILMQDVIDFKRGSDNIYDLQYRYKWIAKIIKNRTKEKINILKMYLDSNTITQEEYNEYFERAKNDYKMSALYVMGLISHLE